MSIKEGTKQKKRLQDCRLVLCPKSYHSVKEERKCVFFVVQKGELKAMGGNYRIP